MKLYKNFNHSYWEIKSFFKLFDLVVIGSGIVGISAAISYKEKYKKASVLVLERGFSVTGASIKNAGFACFGSSSELLDDLKKIPTKTVMETLAMRWEGLTLLKKRLGEKNIDFRLLGGYEIFTNNKSYQNSLDQINNLNTEIKKTIGLKNCYSNFHSKNNLFNNVKGIIINKYEGQINPSLMMSNLILMAHQLKITILNGINIKEIKDVSSKVLLVSDHGVFSAKKVIVATNGFVNQLLKIQNIQPARAQVLITKPIKNLAIKGTFHFDKGFYYFRNIDNRILLGGGRNIDFANETTTEIGLNQKIQKKLDYFLKEVILPTTPFQIEHRWSGIMGIGSEKKPIINGVSENVIVAVRMGGMGISIGTLVGKLAVKKLS